MPKSDLSEIKKRIQRHVLIKPELKVLLLKDLPNWDEAKRRDFLAQLDVVDKKLEKHLNEELQDESKRKSFFHELSKAKVILQHGSKQKKS